MISKKAAVLIIFILTAFKASAQFEFCNGNSGDPIFMEDFGVGTTIGPALSAGTTSYSFVTGTPSDGSYTISSNTNYFDWHDTTDHTPGDTNGKAFIVNASFVAGEFFRRTVSGLCENTSYEFSSWLMNLLPSFSACPNGGIPINVRFQIWDDTDTHLLASGDTGDIRGTSSPKWEQYGLVFKTLVGQTSVILKMINNGVGGCGNDLAIDDIVFKSCGDFITVTDTQDKTEIVRCENQGGISATLTATPDFSIFNTHSYQWQQSTDRTNWTDILGESTNTYVTPVLNTTTYYRVKVAEDVLNISNPLCNVLSEIFDLTIVSIPDPPINNGDLLLCANELRPLSVSVADHVDVSWYDSPVGGNLLSSKNTTYATDIAGTYYAEASSSLIECRSVNRTAVSLTIIDLPEVSDQNLTFCEGSTTILSADLDNMSYQWNNGEVTKDIQVDAPGTYTVRVTNNSGCYDDKTIVLAQIDAPIIEKIESDEMSIRITTSNTGDFEYAINNGTYQNSPVFNLVQGGLYTIHVKVRTSCEPTSQTYIHLVVPKFFTPNGDNFNDTFVPQGLRYFTSYEMQIFNRFGKLIKSAKNTPLEWDGTFNNIDLPASDYWYILNVEGNIRKGHFALKR